MPIVLQSAGIQHLLPLREFLQQLDLPVSDLPSDLSGFTLAFDAEQIVGTAGLELQGSLGLLRSVAVAATHRNQQLGQQLYTAALQYARSKGVQTVYLITTTADRYFEKHGFRPVQRSEVPALIAQTEQFATLCPSSAVVMKLDLAGE